MALKDFSVNYIRLVVEWKPTSLPVPWAVHSIHYVNKKRLKSHVFEPFGTPTLHTSLRWGGSNLFLTSGLWGLFSQLHQTNCWMNTKFLVSVLSCSLNPLCKQRTIKIPRFGPIWNSHIKHEFQMEVEGNPFLTFDHWGLFSRLR